MATGTVYLRPSADVSLEHTIYPTTLSAGYLAISEEICDNDSTYIEVSTSATSNSITASGTSRFRFSIKDTKKITSVTSASLVLYTHSNNANNNRDLTATVYINGEKCSEVESDVYEDGVYIEERFELANEASALNKNLSAGELPPVEVEIYTKGVYKSDTSKASNKTVSFNISQVFIELECEYEAGLNIYHKQNGVWKQAQAAYKKQNGAWVEITEDECKVILQSGLINS